MPGPNPQLTAALDQFALEPGVTPAQAAQLRAAINATPNLLRSLNADAANGHLRSFALAPPGPESIGQYDIASGRVTLPAEVLTGATPVNPDLRAVLKLQDMSLRFAHTANVTADMHANLERTLNGSPVLIDQFKDAVRNEAQRELRGFALHTAPGAGGSYDPTTQVMNLTPASLTTASFDQHNMSFVLGHEMEHGFNRVGSNQARDRFDEQARQIAGDANPINDYTAPSVRWMQSNRNDEAEAHIAGWNAMLSYEKQRSGNPNAGLTEMWNNANRGRVEDFLELDAAGAPVARANLSFNADNSLTSSPTNVATMGQYYFDQKPVGTPGVAAHATVGLGPHGHSDYANIYGAEIVGRAIWIERSVAVPKHGAASQMHLNLNSLGVNETLLEENGIFIRSTAGPGSQAYRDTSTTPSVAGRFDHTFDGPNQHQHVPIDAPLAREGERSVPGGAGEGPARNESAPGRAAVLSDPEHPGHSMYNSALHGLRHSVNIPPGTFQPHDEERLAAGIVAQALNQRDAFPAARIDHVVFNRDRSMLIGVQGPLNDPTHHLAGVNVQRAIATPIEQSSQASQPGLQSQQQVQEAARIQAETQGAQAQARGMQQ